MASPNISFDQIGGSIRKPGKYFEFNTKLAVRTLPTNAQNVIIIAQRTAAGTAPVLIPQRVFSDVSAAELFGRGSQAHIMVRAAINANRYVQLSVIALDDAAAGIAATGSIAITGPATTVGVLSVWIGIERIDLAVASGELSSSIAARLATLISALGDLPVTSSVAGSTVTLTAKNKGTAGNQLPLRASCTAYGVTPALVQMSGGDIDPDIQPALTQIFGAGHDIIVPGVSSASTLQTLRTHLEAVSGPLEQRGAIGIAGWRRTLASGTTLSSALNSGYISVAWHPGSRLPDGVIAAAYAAVIAGEEDPARPLNTLALNGLDVTDLQDRPGRVEQEAALHNGLTPLEIGPGDKVQIVRAISTYTLSPDGVEDVSLLDLTTIRTLFYVRKALRTRIALRFPREKLSSRTPPKVRLELLDVLRQLEELEIVEEVSANKAALIVERDSQDANRLNAAIPVDVVNGLHVFAGRIDLLL